MKKSLIFEGWRNFTNEAKKQETINDHFQKVISGDFRAFKELNYDWENYPDIEYQFAEALIDHGLNPLEVLFQFSENMLKGVNVRDVVSRIHSIRYDDTGLVVQFSIDLLDQIDSKQFVVGVGSSQAFINSGFNVAKHKQLMEKVYQHMKANKEAVLNIDIMYEMDDEMLSIETEVPYPDLDRLEAFFNSRLASKFKFIKYLDFIDGAKWAPMTAFSEIISYFSNILNYSWQDIMLSKQLYAAPMGEYVVARMEEMEEEIYENKLYGHRSVETSIKTYFPNAYIKNMKWKNWDVYRVSVPGDHSSYALVIKLNYDRNLLEIAVKESDQAYGMTFNAYEKTGLKINNLDNELNYLYYRIIQ